MVPISFVDRGDDARFLSQLLLTGRGGVVDGASHDQPRLHACKLGSLENGADGLAGRVNTDSWSKLVSGAEMDSRGD